MAADLFELEGDHYILLVAMDYYSRFPEIRHLSSTRSANVISAMTEIFACHGIPSEIGSDNGPQFSGAEFQQFAVKLGFRHITSSPRYPQGNGLVERCVQTVKAMLKKARFTGESFSLALLAYRATPHETTIESPAHLLMDRRLRTTLPMLPSHLEPEVVSWNIVHSKDQQKSSTVDLL